MFKKRAIKLTLDKAPEKPKKTETEVIEDRHDFFKKTDYVFKKLHSTGFKVAIAIGVYVVLDTIRQVAVVSACQPEEDN